MAMIPSEYVSKFTDVLLKYVEDEAVMLLGVPGEIEKLHSKLGLIRALLIDAERRQSREEAIKHWLNELKDLMYDADDIMDEIEIENQKRLQAAAPSSLCYLTYLFRQLVSCCLTPFSCIGFRHQIRNKIKSLNTRLDEIIKEKNDFNLTPITLDDQNRRSAPPKIRRITSSLVEPNLVGTRIEEDTRTLVKLLLADDHHQKMSVTLAIIGMGGIGKTTLAQKIFNDEMVQDYCQMVRPLWICVSQDVNETKILGRIIQHLRGDPIENQDRAYLEEELHKVVMHKILFLVLDDVWDASVWQNLLKKPLQSCGYGSKIIITTRSMRVAKGMGAIHLYNVEKLSVEDGWLLLCNSVFKKDDDNDKKHELREIGMKIMEQCDGLPLAINAVAGMLSTKVMRYSECEKVRRNPVWSNNNLLPEDVLGALYLSYEDLPSYLKPCFLFFALYPEDTIFYQYLIQRLWCSERLVEPSGSLTAVETAEEYWKELIQRNLLQPDTTYYDQQGCKIHDLVHTLVRYLAHHETFCGDAERFADIVSSSSSSLMKPRRLYLQGGEVQGITDIIRQQTSLRTLKIPNIQKLQYTDFKSLKCLRILDLSRSPLEELPSSIGDLIHLRYFGLADTKVREIPECIGNLWNLHFLHMRGCKNMHRLPARIVMLHNLKYLNLEESPIDGMPFGIRKLHRLAEIYGLPAAMNEERVENIGGSTLEDLGFLSKLTELSIYKLERVSSRGDARAAALKDKHHLRDLYLRCSSLCNLEIHGTCTDHAEEAIKKIEEVFEELCPPSSLEILEITGYFGLELPGWLRTLSAPFLFPILRKLDLLDCNHFVQLPALGQLPQLDFLNISGASGVTSMGHEFLFGMNDGGSQLCCPSFPMLTTLILKKMPNWREWNWFEAGEELRLPVHQLIVLPRLQSLSIILCPKLRSLPTDLINHAVMLQELYIREANSLREIKNLLFIKKLVMLDCPMLEEVSNLPNLKTLFVAGDWKNLRNVVGMDALQHLELLGRDHMESLPEWLLPSSSASTSAAGEELQLQQFGALQKLYIKGSTNLLSRCLVDGPEWPKIRDNPQVKANTYDGLGYFSYTKVPFAFDPNLKR